MYHGGTRNGSVSSAVVISHVLERSPHCSINPTEISLVFHIVCITAYSKFYLHNSRWSDVFWSVSAVFSTASTYSREDSNHAESVGQPVKTETETQLSVRFTENRPIANRSSNRLIVIG